MRVLVALAALTLQGPPLTLKYSDASIGLKLFNVPFIQADILNDVTHFSGKGESPRIVLESAGLTIDAKQMAGSIKGSDLQSAVLEGGVHAVFDSGLQATWDRAHGKEVKESGPMNWTLDTERISLTKKDQIQTVTVPKPLQMAFNQAGKGVDKKAIPFDFTSVAQVKAGQASIRAKEQTNGKSSKLVVEEVRFVGAVEIHQTRTETRKNQPNTVTVIDATADELIATNDGQTPQLKMIGHVKLHLTGEGRDIEQFEDEVIVLFDEQGQLKSIVGTGGPNGKPLTKLRGGTR